jgi:hypothetical protein
LITAAIAQKFGLAAAMLVGSVSFTAAAAIWLAQRETIVGANSFLSRFPRREGGPVAPSEEALERTGQS